MIYLDNGATSLHKPPQVSRAMTMAMRRCANPGRGGYEAAMAAAETVYTCRETAAGLFGCNPEQVVLTMNCTHGLNIAAASLVKPGSRVVVSGFEHNAVMRPLYALGADIRIAGRKLFDWEDTLDTFSREIRHADAVVFTWVSNVFGYVLPVGEIAALCRDHGIPFIIDAAQAAGSLPVNLQELGADFIAMPGHKGLLGPQGTGLLLCGQPGKPLLHGGTGSASRQKHMPQDLPERMEAGTMNIPGIAGLTEGLRYISKTGVDTIFQREQAQAKRCAQALDRMGMQVFRGEHQAGTVSFVPGMDCEEAASILAKLGIAIRAGLHCAPVAHESAGTLETGTVRVSFGHDANPAQTERFLRAASKLPRFWI